ncbi:MAG: DUF2085 domain-containing protein [bacterium]
MTDNTNVDYRLARKVYSVILIFSLCWLMMIFAAPVFLKIGGHFEKISSYIYFFFSNACHQDDGRSFHLFGHSLAVCSRCVWIYAGFAAGTIIYPVKFKINNINAPSVWVLIIPALILFIDVGFDSMGILMNTFFTRSVSGLLLGLALPMFIIPGFVKFFYEINSFLQNKVNA